MGEENAKRLYPFPLHLLGVFLREGDLLGADLIDLHALFEDILLGLPGRLNAGGL